ncbi:PREDICTED: uncharacterized protein LOC109336056 isoform X1 [Lupinus angustifolius]|uniref:uncharacterized protein LOC109336056 isoform X1 n=1 Tax=Lupinus angustifolius TaxID=3871 RepID=UPI00092EDC65|nr:PREDICTED: uncharacterized protein LOC109336056 isoform X1 [Lupinus angustifolius]XP_019427949.1 PREDICTED: uncharacterized protein LOC109336056 isoform X1 [Lupinus angustifolius]XP_019427950.1 PREDICTED: uncharacterized protein LOC109336056 isoform X1 [Lupinus angustifolius]
MPVSGHEETEVKSFAGKLSGLIAGCVPIKKRKYFPLIPPTSPLSEEPSSLNEEAELQPKENSSTSQASTLSNVSIAGAPIKKRRFPILEEGSHVGENDSFPKENSSTSQGLTLSTSSSGNSDTNEHLLPSIAKLGIVQSSPKIEKVEPVSLELSLSKEKGGTRSLNSDVKTTSDIAPVQSNRANWDLNTTMDAWEEPGTSSSSVKTYIDRKKVVESVVDEKQFMRSSRIVTPTGDMSLKQTVCEESKKKAFVVSPGLYGQHYERIDPHNLCLNSYLPKYAHEPSRLSVKLDSGTAIPTAIPSVTLSSVVPSAGDVNTCFRLVKSEPFDDNSNRGLKEANVCPVGSLDSDALTKEFLQHSNAYSSKPSSVRSPNLVDAIIIKTESGYSTAENKVEQLGKKLLQGSDNCSTMAVPVTLETKQISAETAHSPVEPMCSAELTTSENIAIHTEIFTLAEGVNLDKVCHRACSNADQVPQETVATPMVDHVTDLSDPGSKNSSRLTEEENANDRDSCKWKLINDLPPKSRDSGEGCASDEEKITLSAGILEDDSYGSDYDSEDSHAVTVAVDTERYICDDDYEDGEVREPQAHSTEVVTIREVREVEHPDNSNYANKQIMEGPLSSDSLISSHVMENESKTVIHSEISSDEDGMDIEMHERLGNVIDKNVCLQEPVADEKSNIASDEKGPLNILQREQLDVSESYNAPRALETELSSDQSFNGSHGLDVVGQCAVEVVKTADTVRQANLDLPQIEASANSDDAMKDVSNCGNQGRIIDLSRAASSSSPSKTRPIPGTSQPSLSGRDLLSDTLDVDKFRGRDEVYIDGRRRFFRGRHQDMSPRSSRFTYVRGRGRGNSRLDAFHGEWESGREFSGEFYNGPSQFRGPRPNKYASANADTDLEYDDAPDGSYVGNGRMGRKPLNDGSYIAPRRRSPGGVDGMQMGHRIPRNMSPTSRCIGSDSSEMVSMRHSEKFVRGFQEDNLHSMFTRPRPFEGMDGRFSRGGGRNFSSIQKRGPPRIRSKSPIGPRSRSPGQWSSPRRSPRRRSPESFGGHSEMNSRRSPLYRVDRMRSPDRPVFSGERVVRRHGSPSYMSRASNNDIRDIDSAREHGHPRSVINNRSPSGRILVRSRRFDAADVRDRADNDDDYYAGPMHSGRVLELSGEGNGEERRFGERRGGYVRSFRPPYKNGNNINENFHLNAEEGPRQYRFCSDDSDFHERGNSIRGKDFERRIRGGRPVNVPPRRTRNMDEQEENFRHGGGGGGGHVWNDDSFDDMSRVKRKRF